MIETTEAINDEGVRFTSKVEFVEPYEYENGVHIEYVSIRQIERVPETAILLNSLGLRKVGIAPYLDAYIYAPYPLGYIQYKIAQHILTGYFWLVKFLYNNARMFQQIPVGTQFSWKYFTPYAWLRRLYGKEKRE